MILKRDLEKIIDKILDGDFEENIDYKRKSSLIEKLNTLRRELGYSKEEVKKLYI